MQQGDPLQILLSHDRWATAQILAACAKLSDEQLHRTFDIGQGSLHATLVHIIGVVRSLTDTLAGAQLRPRIEADGQRRTAGELQLLLDDSYRAFAAEAGRRPLGEIVSRTMRDGRTLSMSRSAVFVHVATHAMHHRAQCLNMLRRLGVAPLPPASVAEWTLMGEPGL